MREQGKEGSGGKKRKGGNEGKGGQVDELNGEEEREREGG